jgi:hypothetical protein
MRHKSNMNVAGESDRSCTTFEVPEHRCRRSGAETAEPEENTEQTTGVPSAKRRQQVPQNQSMENRSKKQKPYLVSPIFANFQSDPVKKTVNFRRAATLLLHS